jgi:hypothetical protein
MILNVHLPDLPKETPVEIWFQMLCSRGLGQTARSRLWNRSALMS